jgi:hypothetical protein
MFEAVVQITWMLKVENDRPTVWSRLWPGKNKAMKLHTEEALAKATRNPKELLEGVLAKLEKDVNRDVEDFQDISTARTFIDDMTLATMAEEVGTGEMYDRRWGRPVPPCTAIGRRSMTSISTAASIRSTDHMPCSGWSLPKSPERALPFLAERFSRWVFDAYVKATGYEEPTDVEANEPAGDGEQAPVDEEAQSRESRADV